MRAEVRARTLTGRHQISDGGLHLVDGVPFGRPYLRQPNRPAVRIPPRKRQRLEEITDEDEVQLLMGTQQDGINREQDVVDGVQAAFTEESDPQRTEKTVRFEKPDVDMDMDDDSEEDDDDFSPGVNSDDIDSEESEDTDSDSSASDASVSGSDSDSSSNDSSTDSDSDSDSDAAPEVQSSKIPVPRTSITSPSIVHILSPPGEGKRTTQSRNARRAKTNRLKHLKETGKLHEDADLKDLERYEEETRAQQQSVTFKQPQTFAQSTGKRKRLAEIESAEVSLEEEELAKRKQEMMARLGQDSDITAVTEQPVSSKIDKSTSSPSGQKEEAPQTTPEQTPERKRLRPDVSAIGRMLARQTKNLVKKVPTAKEPTPEPEGSTDPEFWKSRINLSAFECWEEEYELTAPPFPFQQHWDPVSKIMRDAAKKKKGKKGGKKPAPVEEPEEEEEEEEEKIYLNYDDIPDEENPDAMIHAAIEDQLQQDIATAPQEQSDLPLLPADLTTLPDLTSADIKAGAVIVCRFFGVNPITVTPEISNYKTAIVDREGDSGTGAGTIRLRIAERDLPKKEKKFDGKGNRVYDAKDGFFMDDGEEEGLWSGMFGELLEGKLLKAA